MKKKDNFLNWSVVSLRRCAYLPSCLNGRAVIFHFIKDKQEERLRILRDLRSTNEKRIKCLHFFESTMVPDDKCLCRRSNGKHQRSHVLIRPLLKRI
ncbi:hypothetical protein Y032_0099g3212 [Ancylostoma ceylanicum]|uniref:Uncharacterized protein n=1 Tax=Ancylostoma ceylanicum TaxID=53326 RepID=A0A016TI61_9BILA|nr:hypothetical protein Y032_0099g3212 [Ancylostoma ceylanicum]